MEKNILLLLFAAATLLACGSRTGNATATPAAQHPEADTLAADTTDDDALYAADLLEQGREVPDFTLRTLDGKSFTLSSLRGQYVVLEFWASWCPDCRKDLPEVVALSKTFMPKGVAFVGVSHDTAPEKWAEAVEKYHVEYIQVSELRKMRDSEVAKAFGVHWIPSYYVIAPDGRVVLATVVVGKLAKTLNALGL